MKSFIANALLVLLTMATGCAHGQLRESLNLGPFESLNVEHLQTKADAEFPIGTPYGEVRSRLGKTSGEIPTLVLFLTFRSGPVRPWSVDELSTGNIRAESERDKSVFHWWMQHWLTLYFEFDESRRLRSVTVRERHIAL